MPASHAVTGVTTVRESMDEKIIRKLNQFFAKYKIQQLKKGELLIRAGDDPQGIYYLSEGLVRRYAITSSGEELVLNMYKPHSFFPMSWAISNVHNTHFYEAMTDITVRRAPKDDVVAFIKQEPDVQYDLLRRLYIGIEGVWMHIEHLMTGSAHTKLLTAVIIFAKRFGKQEGNTVIIPLRLTEKDLAEYAGMSRETASRELKLLKKEHLITFEKGTIIVNDMKELENALSFQS